VETTPGCIPGGARCYVALLVSAAWRSIIRLTMRVCGQAEDCLCYRLAAHHSLAEYRSLAAKQKRCPRRVRYQEVLDVTLRYFFRLVWRSIIRLTMRVCGQPKDCLSCVIGSSCPLAALLNTEACCKPGGEGRVWIRYRAVKSLLFSPQPGGNRHDQRLLDAMRRGLGSFRPFTDVVTHLSVLRAVRAAQNRA
jgi:hypothetical protein